MIRVTSTMLTKGQTERAQRESTRLFNRDSTDVA